MAKQVVPLYRLANAESGEVILTASAMTGFFVSHVGVPSEKIIFSSASLDSSCAMGTPVDDIELQVLDVRGEVLGSYYVGRVLLRAADSCEESKDLTNVVASFYGYSSPYPHANEVWQRWASLEPVKLGEWHQWPTAWLHVAQKVWFRSGHSAKKYGSETDVAINGAEIYSEDGFFCALGESVNGPGGYYGATLSGLADCLSGSQGVNFPFRLHWKEISSSKISLGWEFVDHASSVLTDAGVLVVFE
ncbi:hypothetical protein ABZ901_04175 [Actinacidiphila alni]|uniref:barstar family protein n=1 Tax=Actinacidiphila alni TaxID=380248 RepID=UPI0033F2FE1D